MINSGDTAWVLISAALVFIMVPGLGSSATTQPVGIAGCARRRFGDSTSVRFATMNP